jgi:hypothetical protein
MALTVSCGNSEGVPMAIHMHDHDFFFVSFLQGVVSIAYEMYLVNKVMAFNMLLPPSVFLNSYLMGTRAPSGSNFMASTKASILGVGTLFTLMIMLLRQALALASICPDVAT